MQTRENGAQDDTPAEQVTQWKAIITLALATLIVASELSISAFGLPMIAEEFGVSSKATAWVLLAYALPLAALAISAGRWVDRADIRMVFMCSLVCVGLASILTALTSSFPLLLLTRLLQGLVSALYLAVYFPTVTATVHYSERGRAMGFVATIMMVGSIAMAPLGGYVATHFGWREVFLIKLPLLALILWMGYYTIPRHPERTGWLQRLPFPEWSMLRETLLIGGVVTCGLLALEQLETNRILALGLAVAAAGLALWWVRLPASNQVTALIGNAAFGLPVLALMLMASVMGLVIFSLPFFIADVMQRSPDVLGVAMMAFVIMASVIAPFAGSLADRFGPERVSTVGGAIMVGGVLSLLGIDDGANAWSLSWRMAWIGLGMAVFNSPNLTAILRAAPGSQAGTAGGISTVARTVGNAVGPAVAALAWSLGGGGLTGFRAGVLALSVLVFCGMLALAATALKRSRA